MKWSDGEAQATSLLFFLSPVGNASRRFSESGPLKIGCDPPPPGSPDVSITDMLLIHHQIASTPSTITTITSTMCLDSSGCYIRITLLRLPLPPATLIRHGGDRQPDVGEEEEPNGSN
ncbi:hypothetical protein EYF80_003594 [Liparis tanakae]|uniref:Uncharacterized protein n=1 Tax=Liparis tanakae TaxID=230148 RepID=A0A4Z2J822_9TELE|nr:hypothetical protein EYF80_003594 [Liparis tanakae]